MHSFWQFENRWLSTATLRRKNALSVGDGASLMPAGSELAVRKTPEGIPYIPGSSFKGVVRSYREGILRTMQGLRQTHQGEGLWACDPLDEKNRCVAKEGKEKLWEQAEREDARFTELVWRHSWAACRLFGSQWLASRVSFQDVLLSNRDRLVRLTEVRDGVGVDRDLGWAKPKSKYDFETVPRGAEFGLTLVVEKAEEWEVGLDHPGVHGGNWGFLSRDSRTDYLLGVISLADTLWASDMLDYATEQAVRLPLSAADYRTLVDAACVYLPAGTKVIAVLYAVK